MGGIKVVTLQSKINKPLNCYDYEKDYHSKRNEV